MKTIGVVRGRTLHVLDTNVDQFVGIPYAEPPVGKLRFAKPEPISKPFPNIIDATKPKNSCLSPIQLSPDSPLSEDCLVLNIWTTNTTALKPVMFWIYGGGLAAGSIYQPEYNGSVLATNDVVVVSVNYRLGAFGFLYGDREDAPGNVGFYDQLLGMKWVRENIHSFGGDRDRITIFGESSGSESVSAHILSPLSKDLFKRAIMQSGANMYNRDRDVVNKTEAISQGKAMAKGLKCNETEDWIQCLRRADVKDILKYWDHFDTYPVSTLAVRQFYYNRLAHSRVTYHLGVRHICSPNGLHKLSKSRKGHMDSDWPQLLNDEPMGAPKVHGLDPKDLRLVLSDPFHATCDGVWADYFL
ncbi:unnamed protein product [Medioppia subpectinata]|uniref:Carboxylic ester hydrolase n=1 Tax=Medioppia subpectinata TaxID=1979941 RepID=A0A7R9KFS0_9ACAR|nr:unnamed protein product [Medioppia subpectinata]CAG2102396.1 unnamed protein product [Medioppia subpectinata]